MFEEAENKKQGGDNSFSAKDLPQNSANKQKEEQKDANSLKRENIGEAKIKHTPVEDMFAETDKQDSVPAKPDVFQAKPQTETKSFDDSESGGHNAQKIFVLIAIVLFLALGGVGIYWFLHSGFSLSQLNFLSSQKNGSIKDDKASVNQDEENSSTKTKKDNMDNTGDLPNNNQSENTEKDNQNKNPDKNANDAEDKQSNLTEEDFAETPEIDTDKDGLSDEEETVLGTDINKTDTDGDGLFDREEVEVYDTDPLNPDTDGDGYQDGAEVKNGYNPNGAGKLYNIGD